MVEAKKTIVKENYFNELSKVKCVIEKKKNLSYVSWTDSWKEVKNLYPDSNYVIYENSEWFPFWDSKYWIDVKVWVIINWLEHIVRLPVMDWANKSMKFESYKYTTKYWEKTVEGATTFDINKAIMRALVKWIAMHWLWLYVYRGEDFPEIEKSHIITLKEYLQAQWCKNEEEANKMIATVENVTIDKMTNELAQTILINLKK